MTSRFFLKFHSNIFRSLIQKFKSSPKYVVTNLKQFIHDTKRVYSLETEHIPTTFSSY